MAMQIQLILICFLMFFKLCSQPSCSPPGSIAFFLYSSPPETFSREV